jgi:hypothetical protein
MELIGYLIDVGRKQLVNDIAANAWKRLDNPKPQISKI